jgi:hypothetical protein
LKILGTIIIAPWYVRTTIYKGTSKCHRKESPGVLP